jgi:hypothetical protein
VARSGRGGERRTFRRTFSGPFSPATTARTFAAPDIIIVHGDLLPERRVIASWHENHKLLLSVIPPAQSPVFRPTAKAPFVVPRGRSTLQLALFWGRGLSAIAESPERLSALRPEQAHQQGTFYPASGEAPALLVVGGTYGVVSDSGLAVLRRHGVPIRVPQPSME